MATSKGGTVRPGTNLQTFACMLALAFGVAGLALAEQPEWRWSHPLPHGNNVADLAVHAGAYVHVTDHGGIYTSTDRWNWVRRSSGTLQDLRGVAHMGQRTVVVGAEGTVLWSDDGAAFQAGTVSPATLDWLEGVATSADRAVAVGDNGAIYLSSDGRVWARVNGLPFTAWLSGVAYGGGVFVAVGETGFIASSPNGTSWTRRTSPTTVDLLRVAYGDGRFLVTGKNGSVLTSVNGTTWNADGSTGTTNSLLAPVLGVGERLAVGESAFWLRTTSSAWLNQTLDTVSPSPAPVWTYVAGVWDGTRYLVGGRTGVFVESFRTNSGALAGQTLWFRNDESPRNGLWDVARFEGAYLAVGEVGTILSSASGVSWNTEAADVAQDTVLYGMGGSPRIAIAVGSSGTILRSSASFVERITTNQVVIGSVTNILLASRPISLIGVQWDVVAPVTTNTLQGVAWNGTRYVVVGAQGTVLTSVDATNWTRSNIPGAGFLSSVSAFGSGFVASGAAGSIYSSMDGLSWVKRVSGTTNWIYRTRAVGESLLAVGQNGTLLSSTDAVSWTPRVSGTTAWLTDVARVGRFFHVSGTQGTCLRSTNTVDWEALSLPTGKALYALASDGAQLVAAGAEGVILRTLADPMAKPVSIAAYAHFPASFPGSSAVDGMMFQGSAEQRLRWEDTGDWTHWSQGQEVVLDSNGEGSVARVASEPHRFFRAANQP